MDPEKEGQPAGNPEAAAAAAEELIPEAVMPDFTDPPASHQSNDFAQAAQPALHLHGVPLQGNVGMLQSVQLLRTKDGGGL